MHARFFDYVRSSFVVVVAVGVAAGGCRQHRALQTIAFGAEGPPTVILLHGYGSSAEEWTPFTQTIQLPPTGRFLFPQAPFPMTTMEAQGGRRAWWPLDLASYRSSPRSLPDLTHTRPPGLADGAALVGDLLKGLSESTESPIVLGGFSQGAMVAAEVAFRSSARIDALMLLSATPVDEASWQSGFAVRRAMPVFVSHGRSDPVLSFDLAERFQARLRAAGVKVTWVPFDGGHEMPTAVVTELNRFLKGLELVR